MNAITQKEIAARLGLTQSAVSRGLRNDPRIPAETKAKIKELCKQLDYRPDRLLSDLASCRWDAGKVRKSSVIAYINRLPITPYIGGLDLIPALRGHASEFGYDVVNYDRARFDSSAQLQRVLRNRGITDVILGPILTEAFIVELDWRKFICVQLFPGLYPLPLNSVTKDAFDSIVLAWEKAVSHGYERIGVVLMTHPVRVKDDVLRRSAVDACQKYLFPHLPPLTPFLYQKAPRPEDFLDWFRKCKPEVIIDFNASHREILRAELRRETPYISLHTHDHSDVAGILEGSSECAREAVNLLHFCHRSHQWGVPKQRIDHVIEPTWYQGSSLPEKAVSRVKR